MDIFNINYNLSETEKANELYKRQIPAEARSVLFDGYINFWTGRKYDIIAMRMKKILNQSISKNLLMKFRGQTYFDDTEPTHKLGKAGYALFIENDCNKAFTMMKDDCISLCVISYFLFVYDDSRFMPLRKRYMNAGLGKLGYEKINDDFNSYMEYMSSLKDIQTKKNMKSLYDAHDFLWVIGYITYRNKEKAS